MTTIVVLSNTAPTTILFEGDDTTVLIGASSDTNVVMGNNFQTVIFNTEGPVGPNGNDLDPGDLVALYNQSKDI